MNGNEPTHTDEAIEAVAELERAALEAISRPQFWIERVTNRIGRPLTVYLVVTFIAVWVGTNVFLHARGAAFDPPPFYWLQGILSTSSLLVAILILTTANRVSEIDGQRDKLDLQINLLNERRSAKIIRMLDDMRRDLPELLHVEDPEVEQLAAPTDTQEVVRAIAERTPPPPGT